MKNFRDSKVTVTPKSGAVLFDCIKEAIVMAISEDRVVTFTHNVRTIVVDPNDIVSFISMACQESRK